MVIGGAGCVIAGGLVAAVTGPADLDKGSWLAAYLVLVCGVGTYVIGTMQGRPAAPPMPRARGLAQLGCWCLGNAAVIVGSLTAVAVVVDVGAALLVIALAVALADALRGDRSTGSRMVGWAYRGLLVVLMISTPVGAVLAHLRDGG